MTSRRPEPPPLDFLSDAEALLHRPIPAWLTWTQYLLLALLITALVWSALARIDMLVVGPGKLVTSPATLVVQPLETGVVRSIDVVVGQTVEPGQRLATLDSTFAAADLTELETRRTSLIWQERRLRALLNQAENLDAVPTDTGSQLQLMIFIQQKLAYRAQMAEHDRLLQRLREQIQQARASAAALQDRMKTLAEIVNIHEELKTSEGGSRYKLLASRDAYQGVAVDLQREVNQSADLERQIAVEEAQRDSWVQDWRQKLLTELQTVQNSFVEATQLVEKARHRAQLITLTAPAAAIVLELAPRPVGAVAKEAEPLVTLVPLHTPLTAEVEIADREIGFVHAGQTARIKVDAFPFQQHGTLPATLETVSADAFVKERQNEPVYRARLHLDSVDLAAMQPGNRLLPGATVQAEIVVGRRSVLSYLLNPLLKSLDEGLHEP
jgi:HlyD family secretion protein